MTYPNGHYLQEITPALAGALDAEGMKEEGDAVVPRGPERHAALHVAAVAVRPPGTPQVAKRLVVFPVAILEKK